MTKTLGGHSSDSVRAKQLKQNNNTVARSNDNGVNNLNIRRTMPLAAIITAIIIWTFASRAYRSTASEVLEVDNSTISSNQNRCGSIDFSATRILEYNFTTEDTTSSVNWKFLDMTEAFFSNRFHGIIYLDKALNSQASEIEIHLNVSSTRADEMHTVSVFPIRDAYVMRYESLHRNDACTQAVVSIRLKPNFNQTINLFAIHTELLDINVARNLNWKMSHLSLDSSRGNIWYDESFQGDSTPMLNQTLSISTSSGTLGGTFVLNGNIDLWTTSGSIYAGFVPQYFSPYNPQRIRITSQSGSITTRTYTDHWPYQPLNHTFTIFTDTGSINAGIPHGSFTYVSSIQGSIDLRVLPFGTIYNASQIHTDSRLSDTNFRLLDAPLESLRGDVRDPLLSLTSTHRVGWGNLSVRYPYSWYGSMEAKTAAGNISFDSGVLDEFEEGDGWVRAKRVRDKVASSVMDAFVYDGDVDVILGL